MEGPRKIVARFTARCVECDGHVNAGETVFWQQGIGVWHVDKDGCSAAAEARAQSDPELFAARDWGDL